MRDEEEVITSFCLWLTEQGCAYETINNGTEDEIRGLVKSYIKEKTEKEKEILLWMRKHGLRLN